MTQWIWVTPGSRGAPGKWPVNQGSSGSSRRCRRTPSASVSQPSTVGSVSAERLIEQLLELWPGAFALGVERHLVNPAQAARQGDRFEPGAQLLAQGQQEAALTQLGPAGGPHLAQHQHGAEDLA